MSAIGVAGSVSSCGVNLFQEVIIEVGVQMLEVSYTMDTSVPLDASVACADDYVDFSLVGLLLGIHSNRSCQSCGIAGNISSMFHSFPL